MTVVVLSEANEEGAWWWWVRRGIAGGATRSSAKGMRFVMRMMVRMLGFCDEKVAGDCVF